MCDPDLDLLIKFPLITSEIIDEVRCYRGNVLCQSQDIFLDVKHDQNGKFSINSRFGNGIDDFLRNIEASNVIGYLEKVTDILNAKSMCGAKNRTNSYKRVLHEYSEFTKFYLNIKKSHLETDLSRIEISTVDDGGREHFLEIIVNLDETKDIFRPANVNLPEIVSKQFEENFSNLTEIYSKFLGAIEELQPFFDVMDEVDGNCGVIDPEKPTRRDCHRRIWLDQNLSVMMVLNPANVKSRPELKFLGPERLVNTYMEKLENNLEFWDEKGDFLEEFLSILGIEKFPEKPKIDQKILTDIGECCICFSLRLNEKLPEIICGNKSCENFFHVECLYEWLSSVNSKRIFNQIHGQCPNCEKGISCPLPVDSGVM